MSQTQPPEGVLNPNQPWYPGKVGEKTWVILKTRLTGGKAFGTEYSSFVNLTSADADKLIENLKKDSRGYPQVNQTGGAGGYENLQKYQEWLREEYLEKPSAGTQDFVDTSVTKEETITPPKLPPAHYIQGQKARWEPEFENEIDHAVYFAGKSPLPKGAKQREVLDWLKSLGLTYKQIHDHREKVLEQMRETISVPGVEEEYPYVYIDAVDQDFVIEDDKEYDEEDTEEYDYDLYGSNLDNLLGVINEDGKKDQDQDEKQVIENIEEEIVEASVEEDDEDKEDPMANLSDEDHKRLMGADDEEGIEDITEKLVTVINKPKKESSYTSNKKIFDSMVVNFGRLQSTLDTINNSLEKQNSLIKANIDTQLAIGELVSNQTELLGEKFDAILKEFEKQSDRAKDIADDEKRKAAEDSLEGQRDAAGTRDIDDLTKGGGKSKRGSKIADYYKQKALRRLYRAMPKRLRGGIRKARKIKQTPSRIAARMTRGITNRMPSSVKRVASGASAIKSASKMSNMPGVKTGPLRTLFAGMEYGERKGSGQSELQALGGTGAGLAGGAAGGVGGAKIGAIAGTAIGGAIGFFFAGVGAAPGAAIGLKIGTVAGSLIGGWLGAEKASELADKVTGVHETGGLTKPGTALLHGTEAVINPNAMSQSSLISDVGGMFIGATTGYLNAVGPMAAPVAPVLKGISAQMAKQYDVPSTLTQTNVGGSLPNLSGELKKVKEKRKQTTGEELSGIEKDLLETQDPQSFADKLMKMLDPEGKFQQLLQQINNPNSISPGSGGEVSAEPFVLLGGSQDKQQKGIDFTLKGTQNRAVLGGTVVEIKHSYNPNGNGGDGRKGSGYGNYLVIRSISPLDGSQVDMLYAHFPDGEIKVKQGDTVSVGQDLGRMATAEEFANPKTRPRVGSGTGAHTSLDFLKPGSAEAHPQARPLGDYILKELGKGDKGAIEKARQQAYQQQQTQPPGATPTVPGLGRQGVTGNKDFGTTSGVGSKGYLIVPGHAAGGGAPEEKKLVKQLAKNAYNNLKSKFPDAKIEYQDTDSMFEDTDLGPSYPPNKRYPGFNKQLEWFKQKEKEGWEILEVHMDASIESGVGTGRGVIAPTGELNPVEAHFAKNYGAFPRGHRDLGAPNRGVGLVELGNMSPELQQSSKQNKVSKQQLDALTAPLERSLESALKISPPAQKPRFQSLQGKDGNDDTKYLIVNQQAKPQITGQGSQSASSFVSIGDGRWRSQNEMSTTIRNLYMQRLGQ
jgi:hypothetical protein